MRGEAWFDATYETGWTYEAGRLIIEPGTPVRLGLNEGGVRAQIPDDFDVFVFPWATIVVIEIAGREAGRSWLTKTAWDLAMGTTGRYSVVVFVLTSSRRVAFRLHEVAPSAAIDGLSRALALVGVDKPVQVLEE